MLVVPAPAKVNLFLHITGRRADGYHELETLFTLIDFADTLTIEDRPDGRILRSTDVPGVPERGDLALRAALALRDASGSARGASIGVEKRIPQGAGLGGGSSDAASVLLALNRLWSLAMPREELCAIGAGLGADVPFFVGGSSALARGVGERLAPVSTPLFWLALALPTAQVATASVFAACELTRSTASAKMNVFSEGYGRNDLESLVAARVPAVAAALAALRRATPLARMSGSGACVYAMFEAEDDAHAALALLPAGMPGRVARTVARHPLASFA
jgi:4-diphosphocytidyl-2-C-methyl-D-erythritol kinase